jgi:ankyrin repeat protein
MGHASSAALLIDHGADVNSKDVSGMTPLHWVIHSSLATPYFVYFVNIMQATKQAKLSCAELLIVKGADLKATNNKGETALDVANKIKPRRLRPDFINLLDKVMNGGTIGISSFLSLGSLTYLHSPTTYLEHKRQRTSVKTPQLVYCLGHH